MNEKGKVLAPKYDKFRQINRYLEMVADILPYLPKENLQVIDFGSGKAYLTFALYRFLKDRGYEAKVLGLDLKEDVVAFCQETAEKLKFSDLQFAVGDIAGWRGQEKVDLVVSLHACDTATDAALAQAIIWQAKVILAVPCCQHELMPKLNNPQQMALLRHGILRERLGALVTDSLRGELLELFGYKCEIMEFIDLEHTPKNLLIRGIKQHNSTNTETAFKNLEFLLKSYGLENWTMYRILEKEIESLRISPQ